MTGSAESLERRHKNVALVLVSHSRKLAEAVEALARQMAGDNVEIICAAGAGENGETLGTDAMAVMQAIESANRPEGVLVLMDLGSALLSTDLALELLSPDIKENVHLTGCAFVEGTIAAATRAAAGASIEEVLQEVRLSLAPKQDHLGEANGAAFIPVMEVPHAVDASVEVVIVDPNGLHARPAARIATLAGSFNAKIFLSHPARGTGPAPATSLVALSSLGARYNDKLQVTASGPDAEKAVASLASMIAGLTGADDVPPPSKPVTSSVSIASQQAIPIARGIALGPALYLRSALPPIPDYKTEDIAKETEHLKRALADVRKELTTLASHDTSLDIMGIQIALLDDPALSGTAQDLIAQEKFNAAAAWAQAVEDAASVYAKLDDPYMKARETDVRDIGRSVLKILLGAASVELTMTEPCILIADDLAPSEAAQLDASHILGVIDRRGGPTSHASILLRAAGIPALAGAAAMVPDDGVSVIGFDGSNGDIWINPNLALREEIEQKRAVWQQELLEAARDTSGTVTTRDGHDVELWANVSGIADARAAKKAGALGIGLLRTEMLFLDRADAPDEEEQTTRLRAIFEVFAGCPIVVRTLDAGGDKQIPYLKMEHEANPYLGVRGVRLCLENESLFITQLRAILRAGYEHDIRIMIPMITDPAEIEKTRLVLDKAHQALAAEKIDHLWPVPLGIMVEVPATAIRAKHFAACSDFFSIGTNDLTQYTLAAERGHPHLEHYADAANPAVLDLIHDVVQAGTERNRSVSVCGEAAGNPSDAKLLVGLGVKRLSMGAASLATIRETLKNATFSDLEQEARQARQNPK